VQERRPPPRPRPAPLQLARVLGRLREPSAARPQRLAGRVGHRRQAHSRGAGAPPGQLRRPPPSRRLTRFPRPALPLCSPVTRASCCSCWRACAGSRAGGLCRPAPGLPARRRHRSRRGRGAVLGRVGGLEAGEPVAAPCASGAPPAHRPPHALARPRSPHGLGRRCGLTAPRPRPSCAS